MEFSTNDQIEDVTLPLNDQEVPHGPQGQTELSFFKRIVSLPVRFIQTVLINWLPIDDCNTLQTNTPQILILQYFRRSG